MMCPPIPPLIAIEVVSREDRYTAILEKLEEYRRWGVGHIWLVDPWLRKLSVYEAGSLQEVTALPITEYGVQVQAATIL